MHIMYETVDECGNVSYVDITTRKIIPVEELRMCGYICEDSYISVTDDDYNNLYKI